MQNNPIRFNDPTGHMLDDADDGGLTAAGHAYVAEQKKLEKLRKDLKDFKELPTYDEKDMRDTTFVPAINIPELGINVPAVTQNLTPEEYWLFLGADGELDRVKLLRFGILSRLALDTALRLYPGQPNGSNPRNAFQHAYWSALMTKEFGVGFAEAVGNAHEHAASARGYKEQQFMDLYNNEVGRGIAQNNRNAPGHVLVAQIQAAVQNGDMVVLDDQNQILFSDQQPSSYWIK